MTAAKKKTAEDLAPELELEDQERTELAEEMSEIAEEAKKTFSLKDRVKGKRTYGKAKVPFILDTDAAEKHTTLNHQSKVLAQMHAAAVSAGQPAEEIQRHLERFNEVDAQREVALNELLSGMLVAHLAGGPSVISDIAVRKARKYLGIKAGSKLNDDESEDLRDEAAFQNFQAVLVHIKAADGSIAEFTPDELREFRRDLDLIQRNNLDQAVNLLLFRDAVGESAVNDPGF